MRTNFLIRSKGSLGNLIRKGTYQKTLKKFSIDEQASRANIDEIPSLKDFIQQNPKNEAGLPNYEHFTKENLAQLSPSLLKGQKFHVETYGCQMNEADSEIINSILISSGMELSTLQDSNLILLNTCAIRENAESKIWHRLNELRAIKRSKNQNLIIGVLGCMAERLKDKLVDKTKAVDLIVGPDAYRDLPNLISRLLVSFF